LFAAARLKSGETGDAIASFTATLDIDPKDAAALRGRATAYAREQNYPAAIADFSAALKLNAKDMAALKGRGMAALQSGDFAAAIADFSALMVLRPEDRSPLFFRANAKLQGNNPLGAAADFTSFLGQHAGDTEALMGRALAYQFTGNYLGAETDLSTLLMQHPDAVQALVARGYVRVMAGKYAEAAADLARVADLPDAPPEVFLWRYIADTRAGHKGDAALAAAAARQPADQWPTAVMRYFLGSLTGDDVLADASREPGAAPARLCEAYFYLGEAALILKDATEATKLFKAALATGMVRYTEYAGAQAELARLEASTGSSKP